MINPSDHSNNRVNGAIVRTDNGTGQATLQTIAQATGSTEQVHYEAQQTWHMCEGIFKSIKLKEISSISHNPYNIDDEKSQMIPDYSAKLRRMS